VRHPAVLERALRYTDGSHTLEDIETGIVNGTYQLWESDDSVIVTEVRETPQQRFLLFFLAAGHMPDLRAFVPPILDWARGHGCVKAQLVGRHGWQRTWLLGEGWVPKAVVMEVDLE